MDRFADRTSCFESPMAPHTGGDFQSADGLSRNSKAAPTLLFRHFAPQFRLNQRLHSDDSILSWTALPLSRDLRVRGGGLKVRSVHETSHRIATQKYRQRKPRQKRSSPKCRPHPQAQDDEPRRAGESCRGVEGEMGEGEEGRKIAIELHHPGV
jgi:hypothetical protein